MAFVLPKGALESKLNCKEASSSIHQKDAFSKDNTLKTSNTMGPQTLALNTHKAGMEGLDADKINDIIKKASEGSRFYQHKQKCQERLDAKIAEMMKAKASFSSEQINKATRQMDQLINELEHSCDLTRTIIHVDMDMFYAAVEMRDNPSLRDKPMAVGGTGMLSTSNYAARKFGVRAAMPGFIGKKLCPDLIIVPPDFTKYKAASKAVQEVFAEYDPNFSPMSLDEAYLDITDYMKTNTSRYSEEVEDDLGSGNVAAAIVREMRKKIQEKTQLTASAGIASNTRLAKICSDMNKPNGQFYLPPDREKILAFVNSLPIRKVSGIGNVTEQQLSALGVKICSDLMDKRGILRLLFSDINCDYFMNIALGLGHTTLEAWTERDRKSTSTETTFRGSSDKNFLFKQTEDLCQELVDDLTEKDIFGKVFTLKIKTTEFQTKTRAHSFPDATRSYDALVSAARKLLQHEMDASSPKPLSLRLIGVRMSNLISSLEMGSSRQVTITQMFSKSTKSKVQEDTKALDGSTTDSLPMISESNLNIEAEYLRLCKSSTSSVDFVESSVWPNDNLVSSKKERRGNSKVCLSIDKFFVKSPKKSKPSKQLTQDCPVCSKQIEIDSYSKFSYHVEKCLKSSSTKGTLELQKNSHNCTYEDDADDPNNEIVNVCQEDEISNVMNETGRSLFPPSTSLANEDAKVRASPYNSDQISDLDNGENFGNKRHQLELLCPVCGKERYSDEAQLNSHIDECLSLTAIDEMMHKEVPPSTSSKVSLHSKASGKSFFQSLQTHSKTVIVQNTGQPKKKQKVHHNTLEKYFTS